MSKYWLHNMIGHPMMEVLDMLGMAKLSHYIHDLTLPKEPAMNRSFSVPAGIDLQFKLNGKDVPITLWVLTQDAKTNESILNLAGLIKERIPQLTNLQGSIIELFHVQESGKTTKLFSYTIKEILSYKIQASVDDMVLEEQYSLRVEPNPN